MPLVPTSLRLRHSQYLQYTTSLDIVFGTPQTGVVYRQVLPFRPTGTGHVAQMNPHWQMRPTGLLTCLLLVQLLG